jgi:hypothetical protein
MKTTYLFINISRFYILFLFTKYYLRFKHQISKINLKNIPVPAIFPLYDSFLDIIKR